MATIKRQPKTEEKVSSVEQKAMVTPRKRKPAEVATVTEPVKTARNKKKKVPLVLYEATEKHPAQVQVHEEDVLQGHWSSVITSSAVKPSDKEKYQLRVEMLLKALKEAREDANASYVEEQNFSADLVSYLFG